MQGQLWKRGFHLPPKDAHVGKALEGKKAHAVGV